LDDTYGGVNVSLERDSHLGRFVIRQRIGAGGMGTVYRAFDTVLLREVAIKAMLTDKVADREALVRFRREALSISQLDDPHIVRVIDLVEGDRSKNEPPYIVMELLRGEDLQALIKRGPVEIPRLVDIILQVCAGVGACHVAGFVHRDLKAANVFLTEYNRIETAKVLDFGVAKLRSEVLGDGVATGEVTRNGMVFGTPEYLAPEVFRGMPAGPLADQYALGVLLYTALSGGRTPFELEKGLDHPELKLWRAVMAGEHLPVRAHRWEVPAGLDEVVERAMCCDPPARFPSVHALGEALLPWASERARLQWTAYFTSAPKPPPVHSIPFRPEYIEHARRILRHGSATGPTIPAGQLRAADEARAAYRTTVAAECEGVPVARAAPVEASIVLTTGVLAMLRVPEAIGVKPAIESATTISEPSQLESSRVASGDRRRSWRAKRRLILPILVASGVVIMGVVVLVVHRHDRWLPRVAPPTEIASAGVPSLVPPPSGIPAEIPMAAAGAAPEETKAMVPEPGPSRRTAPFEKRQPRRRPQRRFDQGVGSSGASVASATMDDASALIARGLELRSEGETAEALEVLERALALAPSPRTAGHVGLVEASLGHWLDAERHLDSSLAVLDDNWVRRNRTLLEEAMERAHGHVGRVTFSGPPGTSVSVAGRPVGTLPIPAPVRVAEGVVLVAATAPGFAPVMKAVTVLGGGSIELAIDVNLGADGR
jgi:serine/threonine protein kinase